ncbi:MAG TPA: hypothetical protein VHU83_06335 [Bryobacteraceae bacterium]|jgi:hypothetical protein|nr:hypothetical protein [Bryobacteraceae bacterium]
MVKVKVVKAFSYLDNRNCQRYSFEPGEHELPDEIAQHPYVKKHLYAPPEEPALQAAFEGAMPKLWPPYVPPVSDAPASLNEEPQPALEATPQPSNAAMALTEAKDTMRARRTLQEAVEDARDEFAEYQKSLQPLVASFTDTSDTSFEERASAARQQLKGLKEKLEAAKAELAAFNHAKPTIEELERRAREAERQLDLDARAEIRHRFGANLIRRVALLDELRELETRAAEIYKEADYWTYDRAQGNVRAGILEHLVAFIPQDFWTRNSFAHTGHQVFDQYRTGPRRHAEEWLRKWGMSLEDSGQQTAREAVTKAQST